MFPLCADLAKLIALFCFFVDCFVPEVAVANRVHRLTNQFGDHVGFQGVQPPRFLAMNGDVAYSARQADACREQIGLGDASERLALGQRHPATNEQSLDDDDRNECAQHQRPRNENHLEPIFASMVRCA